MDAGPTVRYGASNPSFVAIFQAWPSWFLPEDTSELFAIMATFSSGMVQYRTTTAYTPSPTERYVVWQGVTRFSGSAIVVTQGAAVSETALAARALATLSCLAPFANSKRAHACRSLSQAFSASDADARRNYAAYTPRFQQAVWYMVFESSTRVFAKF